MSRLSHMIHHHKLTVLFDYLGDRIGIDFLNELRYLFRELTGSGTAVRCATLIPVGLFYFLELKKNIYNLSGCSLSPWCKQYTSLHQRKAEQRSALLIRYSCRPSRRHYSLKVLYTSKSDLSAQLPYYVVCPWIRFLKISQDQSNYQFCFSVHCLF